MTREEKTAFLVEVLDGLREQVLRDAANCPESWDGFELRQLVADIASERYAVRLKDWPGGGKRATEYRKARYRMDLQPRIDSGEVIECSRR